MSNPDTLQAAVDNLIAELRRVWPPEAYDQARQVIDYLEVRLEQISKQFTAAPKGHVAGGPIGEGRSLPVIEAGCEYPVIGAPFYEKGDVKRTCGATRWIDQNPESPYRVPEHDEYTCTQPPFHQGIFPHIDTKHMVSWHDGDAEARPFGLDDED